MEENQNTVELQEESCETTSPEAEKTAQTAAPKVEETDENISPKSKIVTGLLALFLGSYGVDQFYLGKVGAGIGSIGISIGCIILAAILGGILGLLAVVTYGVSLLLSFPVGVLCGLGAWVWPLIRAIKAFMGKATDKDGARIIN